MCLKNKCSITLREDDKIKFKVCTLTEKQVKKAALGGDWIWSGCSPKQDDEIKLQSILNYK